MPTKIFMPTLAKQFISYNLTKKTFFSKKKKSLQNYQSPEESSILQNPVQIVCRLQGYNFLKGCRSSRSSCRTLSRQSFGWGARECATLMPLRDHTGRISSRIGTDIRTYNGTKTPNYLTALELLQSFTS